MNKIAQARRKKGMTQQQAADALGMHRETYARIERGHSTTTDTMQRICKVLGLKYSID